MARLPIIYTWRLKLRPFTSFDASRVYQLANDPAIAAAIPCIPHPYPVGLAERWIASHSPRAANDSALVLAITLRDSDELLGAIELGLERERSVARGDLGYWIGQPYRNSGYATEAARAILRLAFAHLNLHRVSAAHVAGNAASARVLSKIGMTREGVRRQALRRGEDYVDEVEYGIVRGELPPSGLTASFNCVYVLPEAKAPVPA